MKWVNCIYVYKLENLVRNCRYSRDHLIEFKNCKHFTLRKVLPSV